MIKYIKGDLFQLTKTKLNKPLLLAHACNCLGIWGGGIANVFKSRYFSSYQLYHTFCNSFDSPNDFLGTSLLLPVDPSDNEYFEGYKDNLIIVCLFTSVNGQESENEIAKNTELAMIDLKNKLINPELIENDKVRNSIVNYNMQFDKDVDVSLKYIINMPKINNGIFGVSWDLTERSLINSNLNCQVFQL